MTDMIVSVVVCTYNPCEKIFSQALEHLEKAAKGLNNLELIIVNNNSDNGFEESEYFKKFVTSLSLKVINEINPGLTNARLAGIENSKGEVICFLDDDNLVSVNYFKELLDVYRKFPFIGAWSGKVDLKFDNPPEDWTRKYWGMLVERQPEKDCWSNIPDVGASMPTGAGLCIHRSVANFYQQLHKDGKREFLLDRKKGSLVSGGDNDIALCAYDIGLGMGVFKDLVITHYIKGERLSLSYFMKLAEGISFSGVILSSFRDSNKKEVKKDRSLLTCLANFLRGLTKNKNDRKIHFAWLKGKRKAEEYLMSDRSK